MDYKINNSHRKMVKFRDKLQPELAKTENTIQLKLKPFNHNPDQKTILINKNKRIRNSLQSEMNIEYKNKTRRKNIETNKTNNTTSMTNYTGEASTRTRHTKRLQSISCIQCASKFEYANTTSNTTTTSTFTSYQLPPNIVQLNSNFFNFVNKSSISKTINSSFLSLLDSKFFNLSFLHKLIVYLYLFSYVDAISQPNDITYYEDNNNV